MISDDLWLKLANAFDALLNWVDQYVLNTDSLIELALIGFAAMVAWWLAPRIGKWLEPYQEKYRRSPVLVRFWQTTRNLLYPLCWLALQWLAMLVASQLDARIQFMIVVSSLLTAWVVIQLATIFVKNPLASKSIATIAWLIAALSIFGWLQPLSTVLSDVSLPLGANRISALMVVKALLTLGVLLWIATVITNLVDTRIKASPNLTPSIQVLTAKLLKIFIITMAIMLTLSSVGIDLSALAIVGGAVGVGIGFGLQKIFANLISGMILLLDKSIKPGDVIAVGDYYGRVEELGARYVSVWTRDGIEHLIPNEELIVNRVENWSHSQDLLRLRISIGVHYKSNIHQAMELCLQAANEVNRVLAEPKSGCLLRGFGDSSVDLELRIWINDPMNGRANVCSDVLVKVWDKFHAHGIEIPYPQRDLHLRSSIPMESFGNQHHHD